MKKITMIGAAVLLTASSTVAIASSKGASTFSPGQQMRNQTTPTTTKGASEFTPADQMKEAGTPTRGASGFTPKDAWNVKRKK